MEHDRGGCFVKPESIFYVTRPFAGKPAELVGRVMREFPDRTGIDLSLILEARGVGSGDGTKSTVRYHVIRVQVKAGKSTVDKTRLATFLSKEKNDNAKAAYARALRVEEGEIQFHRLLASLAPVAPKVLSMVAAG